MQNLVEKHLEKNQFRRLRRRWEKYIKRELGAIGYDGG
jgi:hypothetical protein